MSQTVLEKLEEKIDQAVEVIELLRLELEEYKESNRMLKAENHDLRQRQTHWQKLEQDLSSLLSRVGNMNFASHSADSHSALVMKSVKETQGVF